MLIKTSSLNPITSPLKQIPRLILLPLLLFLTASGQPGQAQDGGEPPLPGLEPTLRFTHLTAEDGLAQNQVTAMRQDSRGFMWIGTRNGLSRYDGYRFTTYHHKPGDSRGLSHNFVRDILEDKEGDLWVATQGGGLNHFDPHTETFTPYRPDSLGKEIFSLFQDKSSHLWLGGSPASGLAVLDPKTDVVTRYLPQPLPAPAPDMPPPIPAGVPIDHFLGGGVWQITQDNKTGNLWLATDEMPVEFDPRTGQFTHYPLQPDERRLAVLHQDSAGNIWAAGLTGLYQFDPQAGVFTPYPSAPREISSLIEDENGNFWIGSQQEGLSLFDPRAGQLTRRYHHDPADRYSLSSNHITALYQDEAGVIWIGTEDSGLNILDLQQRQFAYYRHTPNDSRSLAEGPVTALVGSQEGALWVGTDAVLNRVEPGTIKHYTPAADPEAGERDDISALYLDRQGLLWLGLNRKLYRFDPAAETFTDYELRLSAGVGPPLRVTSIYEDEAGQLWLAVSLTGLYRFDPAQETFQVYQQPRDPQVTNYDDPHNIANNRVTTLSGDRQGRLWLGYQNGALSRFEARSGLFRHYFLEVGWIEAIYQDQAGRLWLASQEGLTRFDPQTETVQQYTRADGLPDDAVVGILEDRAGNLWLGTKQGLSKFDPRTGRFRDYDRADGLSDNEFMRAAWQAPDGRMFFGGRNGLTAFDPARISDNPYRPPVVLTELRLFNRPVIPDPAGLLPRPIWDLAQVTLPPDQDIISLEFAALSYAAPRKNRYRYKLEGFGNDWNQVDSRRRFATYTNLPPGDYVFRVQGSNEDGVWSDQEASLTLTVLPFWWETTWFRVTALLLAAALGAAGYRWRVFSLRQRSRQLEREVSQRTAELAQAREIFATVLNNLDALVYVADMTTYEILFANNRLKREFGEIEGYVCWQTIQEGQTGPCHFCTNPELLTPAGQPAGIYRWQFQNTRNGRWYAVADSAIEWTDGRLVRLSMGMDITDHKQAEQQLLAQQRLVASIEERERIGRELHDDLGQVMAYVSLQAQAARELLEHSQPDRAVATLSQLAQTAREAHDDVRQYILGIRHNSAPAPPADFFEELNRYLRQLCERYNLDVQVSWPDDLLDTPLAPETETQLLRIIQEALTNVRKHAGVDTARILFTLQPDQVQVIISDEGRGFNPYLVPTTPGEAGEQPSKEVGEGGSQQPAGHFGLEIMYERAAVAGGNLDVRSKPGQGTQVIVHLPRALEPLPVKEVSRLRVLLVDDHPLYLEGMRNMLSTRGVQVIGTAHDGLEAVDLAHRLLPDLILMDVEMPHCNGLEATRRIKAELPDIIIVILTVAAGDDTLFQALKSGAAGYLLKNLDSRQFFSLLAEVMRGETVLSPSLATRVLTEFAQGDALRPAADEEDRPTLTARQEEVLALAAQGLTNREIAQKLHISPATVKYHIAQILERLQLKSRYELAHYVRRQSPPDD